MLERRLSVCKEEPSVESSVEDQVSFCEMLRLDAKPEGRKGCNQISEPEEEDQIEQQLEAESAINTDLEQEGMEMEGVTFEDDKDLSFGPTVPAPENAGDKEQDEKMKSLGGDSVEILEKIGDTAEDLQFGDSDTELEDLEICKRSPREERRQSGWEPLANDESKKEAANDNQ